MQWLIPHIASSDRVSSVWSSREFLYDSDNDLLYYGDGATLGGVSLATGGGGGVAAVSGSNGSFTFNTLTFGALNGVTFYTSNGSLVASYNSTQFQQSSLMTNYLGTTYTSHTHSQYLNTSQSSLFQQTSNTSNFTSNALNISQSSLFQQTSLMTNYLGTGATQSFRFTSNDSQLLFTSQSSLFQATSDNSLSLGTSYTSHTHSQYINTSNSSLFQQTSLMTNYLDTAATQSFRFTSNDSQLVFTSQSSLFQQTSATSAITSNAFPSTQTTKFAGTGTTLNGTNVSLSVTLNSIGLRLDASVAAPGAASLNVSAGTTSANLTALTFANSNGVSFGLNAGTITGTVKTDYQSSGNYLTTARASNDAVGLNTALTGNGVSWTVNSSGISLNIPAFLTTAMQSNQSSNFVNTSQSSLFQQTSNTSAITSNAVNTSSPRLQGIIASNTTYTSGSFSLRDLNGITFQSTTGQGVQITHALQYTSNTSNITASALNTSQSSLFQQTSNTSAITSNALHTSLSTRFAGTGTTTAGTNISLSVTLNSVGLNLAASVNPGGGGGGIAGAITGNTSGVLATVSTGTMVFAGGNNITLSQNGQSITISGPNVGGAQTGISGLSAGTTQMTSGTAVFINSNGISFGVNGNTITASYNSTQFLTTAMASNAFTSLAGTGTSATNATFTLNSLGLAFNGSVYQLTSNTSAITASALNTSQSSLFQQTSLMTNYLGTTASLNDLADVVISSATLNQILKYNGTNWINATQFGSGTAAPSGGVDGDIYLQYT
jgi:hypothetical protein